MLSERGADDISFTGSLSQIADFEGRKILVADFSSDGLSVYLSGLTASEGNLLLVFDKNGRQIYRKNRAENYASFSRSGKTLYAISDGCVDRLNLSSGKWERMTLDTGEKKLLSLDGDELILCTQQKAVTLSFRPD